MHAYIFFCSALISKYIFRAMCPDRILAQTNKYVASSLGLKFTEPILLDLNQLLVESNPHIPIICFLTMGSDPTRNIEASSRHHDARMQAISMGQGQEVHARVLMDRCMTHVSRKNFPFLGFCSIHKVVFSKPFKSSKIEFYFYHSYGYLESDRFVSRSHLSRDCPVNYKKIHC